ncbi:MAG: hypothetical protein SFU91_05965 [Chloroherpetonaceae bacterium]|nr:hypothetical protein [Chloroherpetonaceae bacterium]
MIKIGLFSLVAGIGFAALIALILKMGAPVYWWLIFLFCFNAGFFVTGSKGAALAGGSFGFGFWGVPSIILTFWNPIYALKLSMLVGISFGTFLPLAISLSGILIGIPLAMFGESVKTAVFQK